MILPWRYELGSSADPAPPTRPRRDVAAAPMNGLTSAAAARLAILQLRGRKSGRSRQPDQQQVVQAGHQVVLQHCTEIRRKINIPLVSSCFVILSVLEVSSKQDFFLFRLPVLRLCLQSK